MSNSHNIPRKIPCQAYGIYWKKKKLSLTCSICKMQRTSVLRLMVIMIPSVTAKMMRFSMVKPSFTTASSNYRGKHAAFESHVSVPLHGRQRHAVHISRRMDGVGVTRKMRFRSACTHWIAALTTDRKRCMGENKMTLCVTVAMVTHMQGENSR